MSIVARRPIGPLIVLVAGGVGALLSAYAYLTPLTGITGSAGALLVLASSLALVIDALILWRARRGPAFWLFWALGVLGAIGTLTAASFLHAWWLMAANVLVLAGLALTLTSWRQSHGAVA